MMRSRARSRRIIAFSIYTPPLQRERDISSHGLDISPEAKAQCSALALSMLLDGSEEENDAGAPAAAGSRLAQQAIISVMGPVSGFYEMWLLVKAAGPGKASYYPQINFPISLD